MAKHFEPIPTPDKAKTEIVRITLPCTVVDQINEITDVCDLGFYDVLRQAIEFALASRKGKVKQGARRVNATMGKESA